MSAEFTLSEPIPQAHDLEIISQILDSPVGEPGSWAKKPRCIKSQRPLSCAEALVFHFVLKGTIDSIRFDPENSLVEFLTERRDRHKYFDLALLKAALVAECLPNSPTPAIKEWLESLRGKRPVLTSNQREVMSVFFGLTGPPMSVKKMATPSVRISKRRTPEGIRGIVQNSLRKVGKRYRLLVGQALERPPSFDPYRETLRRTLPKTSQ